MKMCYEKIRCDMRGECTSLESEILRTYLKFEQIYQLSLQNVYQAALVKSLDIILHLTDSL